MNIAILHSSFTERGGAERTIINESKHFRQRGHRITCFASTIDREKCYPDLLQETRIKNYFHEVPSPICKTFLNISISLLATPLIQKTLRGFDVLLCHHQPGPWIGYNANRELGIPYICYLHHPPLFIYPRNINSDARWSYDSDRFLIEYLSKKPIIHSWLRTIDTVSILKANAVVINSRMVANEIKGIYGISPTICYPGVDTEFFKPTGEEDTKPVMKKYHLEGGPFILATGRHAPTKRFDWAISMMKLVVEEYADAKLIIAGGPAKSYTTKLKSLSRSLNLEEKTYFIEPANDRELLALYNQSDVYIFLPPRESFGLGPIEAMACGTPVVAWDDKSGPTETIQDGRTGLLAEPYSIKDLAEKTLRILSDQILREKMSVHAVSHVRENFSLDESNDRLLNILCKYSK